MNMIMIMNVCVVWSLITPMMFSFFFAQTRIDVCAVTSLGRRTNDRTNTLGGRSEKWRQSFEPQKLAT